MDKLMRCVLLICVVSAASYDFNTTALDCGMRHLIQQRIAAMKLPWADLKESHDALQLEVLCGSKPPSTAERRAASNPLPTASRIAFVAPSGSDEAEGTADKPFATVHRALQYVRQAAGRRTVVLRKVVHSTGHIVSHQLHILTHVPFVWTKA